MTPKGDVASLTPQPTPTNILVRQMLLLAGFIILAALTPMGAKLAMRHIPPLTGGLVRFGTAGSLLMLTERYFRHRNRTVLTPITGPDKWLFFWAALLCVPVNQFCFLLGIKWANASHAGLFYALNPVLTFLITVAIGRSQWSSRMAIAALLAFVGAGTLGIDTWTAGYGSEFLTGDLLLFGAVLTWAIYSIIGAPLAQRYGAVRSAAIVMFYGALLDLPVLLIDGREFVFSEITWPSWAGFVYITIGTSYFNYMLWFVALKQIDINRVSIAVNSAPVFAVLAAYLFLDEPITRFLALGAALIFAAITLANWDKLMRRKVRTNSS